MRSNVQDQEIVKLLTRLKEAERGYPEELLAARRKHYLEQIGTAGLGLGAGKAVSEAVKNAKSPPTSASSSVTSTLLETVLVVAIIAEAGTVAFLYRDKVADFLRTFNTTARVQEVTPPPILAPSQAPALATSTSISTFTPAVTSSVVMATISPSPTGTAAGVTQTPAPGDVVEDINPAPGLPTQAVATQVPPTQPVATQNPPTQVVSTPIPDEDNGDNGNHYGQTPKPERTIEPGNGDQPPGLNQGTHP
jgi:hypothetical protein